LEPAFGTIGRLGIVLGEKLTDGIVGRITNRRQRRWRDRGDKQQTRERKALHRPHYRADYAATMPALREDVANDSAGHIRQPEVAAAVSIRQFGVIDAEQVKDGGV